MTVHATHPYVQVTVNNSKPLWFLLDTGAAAPVNLIDASRATALGLNAAGERSTPAIGGSAKVKMTDPATLSVGSHVLGTHPLAAIDLAGNEADEGHAIDGILGFAFFNERVVTLDYPGHALILDRAPRGGSSVPLVFDGKTPTIKARLSIGSMQEQEVRLVVDTGFDDTLILTRPFVERHALQQLAESESASGQGLGGTITSRFAHARRLSIGEMDFDDVHVRLSMDEKGAFASEDVDGYIGGGLLQHCVVTFDYSGRTMTLRRR